jgi:hypothetical protein
VSVRVSDSGLAQHDAAAATGIEDARVTDTHVLPALCWVQQRGAPVLNHDRDGSWLPKSCVEK